MSYEASSSSLSNQILAVEARICELNKQRTEGTPRRGGMSGSVERRPVSPLDPQTTLRQRLNNKLLVESRTTNRDTASQPFVPQPLWSATTATGSGITSTILVYLSIVFLPLLTFLFHHLLHLTSLPSLIVLPIYLHH